MGLSQARVAKLLGHKDTSLISRWENGTATPSLKNALMLSRVYKRLVNDLFYELDQEAQSKLHGISKSNSNDP
jgi:DNA-binding XRE family transcriptional regulator